eukprot:CAMPEP_0185485960 /NCGR_PEP_ID=MMETSP1366-20130426/10473_1 /TAXON_ID=38817 /ORGANISM="Gephyrocapsa oceanica, Strain RCC1303" /LENGTH=102 /DNA_ID=CAMNT_0028094147 /DNA_START=413 /DNA_END=717 /DNA_ORIENTATION=-
MTGAEREWRRSGDGAEVGRRGGLSAHRARLHGDKDVAAVAQVLVRTVQAAPGARLGLAGATLAARRAAPPLHLRSRDGRHANHNRMPQRVGPRLLLRPSRLP